MLASNHKTTRWMIGLLLAVASILEFGCMSSMTPINTRPPELFSKDSVDIGSHRRGIRTGAGNELYVRERNVQVREKNAGASAGSLFDPNSKSSYLFLDQLPVEANPFITVLISSNLKKPVAATADTDQGDKDQDQVEKELLDSLPELDPKDDSLRLVSQFKMKVSHRYPNGDVLAYYERVSDNGDDEGYTKVSARIPYEKMLPGESVRTSDLSHVQYFERKGIDEFIRQTPDWVDEYSLRISGFDESKSKYAVDLDDKRKKLEESKERLANRMKSFASERKKLTKEREEIGQSMSENNEKVEKMQGKIDEQESTIKEQNQKIAELEMTEKPGDERDGSDGK